VPRRNDDTCILQEGAMHRAVAPTLPCLPSTAAEVKSWIAIVITTVIYGGETVVGEGRVVVRKK
jgi:hypothetical protein